jgi:hypothetical protein
MRRLIPLAALALLLAPAAARADDPRLPKDALIADVPVGGLGPNDTHTTLTEELGGRYERPIRVRVGRRRLRLPTRRLGQSIAYIRMVDAAFA